MKKFIQEFKEFISKGNVVDMAVGVIIGGAFGKIVTSLVNDVIMPLVSLATGGLSVADWKYVFKPAVLDEATGAVITAESALKYGNFIQTVLDFLIIAICIFIMLKIVLAAKSAFVKKEEAAAEEAAEEAPAETTEQILSDIRELLKKDK